MSSSFDADARAIEGVLRLARGVAFAEVSPGEAQPVRIALWRDADEGECVLRVRTILRDRFSLDVRPDQVRIVGVVEPGVAEVVAMSGSPREHEAQAAATRERPGERPHEVRVVDLEAGVTWATEGLPAAASGAPAALQGPAERAAPVVPSRSAVEQLLTPPETPSRPGPPASSSEPVPTPADSEPSGPQRGARQEKAQRPVAAREDELLASIELRTVSITESPEEVEVVVETAAGEAVFRGRAGAGRTLSDLRRALCEATLRSVEEALGSGARFGLESVGVVEAGERCAVVVVSRVSAGSAERLAGAAVEADLPHAFVQATLQAVGVQRTSRGPGSSLRESSAGSSG